MSLSESGQVFAERPFLRPVFHTNVLFVGWLFAFSPSNAPVYLRDGDKRKEGNMKALCETAVSLFLSISLSCDNDMKVCCAHGNQLHV